jgi:serine/threonine-protein kinase RsbW
VPELAIRIRDQGEGFDPEQVANPLDAENLLKSSGRGIFLIRNFMDDVQLQRAPEGGMEIRMVKRVQPPDASEPA